MSELYPAKHTNLWSPEEIDASLEQIIEEYMEPETQPKPELSAETMSILLYRIHAITAFNGKRGMVKGEGDYFTTHSRISRPIFEPDIDFAVAMKLWEHKANWAGADIDANTPVFRVSYHQILNNRTMRLAEQSVISIEFRTPNLDVPVFSPFSVEANKRDTSLTDARALQLLADMQSGPTFVLPNEFEAAA